jgi:hypothetical protein
LRHASTLLTTRLLKLTLIERFLCSLDITDVTPNKEASAQIQVERETFLWTTFTCITLSPSKSECKMSDAVFIIDLIVSTEHSMSKAHEILETLLFAFSLDIGHFIHLRFHHPIAVFNWI